MYRKDKRQSEIGSKEKSDKRNKERIDSQISKDGNILIKLVCVYERVKQYLRHSFVLNIRKFSKFLSLLQ